MNFGIRVIRRFVDYSTCWWISGLGWRGLDSGGPGEHVWIAILNNHGTVQ